MAKPLVPCIKMSTTKIRMFIDPALISSGWALFEDKKLINFGDLYVNKHRPDNVRFKCVYDTYERLFKELNPDEIHIEQTGGRVHYKWTMCIGVLLAAGGKHNAAQDIPVSSWQKYCDWHGKQRRLAKYKKGPRKIVCEDTLSAVGMGLWYLKEKA